jgi:hypothetical protein
MLPVSLIWLALRLALRGTELVAGVAGDLGDRLGGQLQVVMEVHEPGHCLRLLSGVMVVSV